MTRILIVDDKEENVYYLHALLTGHGWVVETARTLPEWSRYWNMRLPGTARRMAMARTSLAASHSLRTALPPCSPNSVKPWNFDFPPLAAAKREWLKD